MKAKDLMIGDVITFKDALEDKVILPVKIVAIGYQWKGEEDEVLAQIGDDDTCDIIVIDEECVGIPITDELLEKNGFKPQGTGWILEDSIGERIFSLCRISNAYCLLTAGMTLAFQHVHELQHLFRIAGMTREIKL